MKVTIHYVLSDEWARKQLLATGDIPPTDRSLEIDLVNLDVEQRTRLLAARDMLGDNPQLADYKDIGGGRSVSREISTYAMELNISEALVALTLTAESYTRAKQAVHDRLCAEDIAEAAARAARDAAEVAKAQAKAAQEQAQADQISVWVTKHGTLNQQQRHAAGLLPREEVLEAMEEEAFAWAAQMAPFVPLQDEDILHTSDYDGHRISYSSYVSGDATAEEWDALQALRAAAPVTAAIELREHRGACQDRDCDGVAYRRGIEVTLQVGAFEFRRELTA